MELPDSNETGVYLIFNKVNGKVYVGSASRSFRKRATTHRRDLRRGSHGNRHLQSAWDKYGEVAFEFRIVVRCRPEHCLKHEQRLIDKLDAYVRGYNGCPTAGSMLGYEHTDETRRKMSVSHTGIPRPKASEETRRKQSLQRRGRKLPPEWVANMSKARKGKPKSEAHRAALISSHWSNGPNADAVRAKIAAGNARRVWSEESKMKISITKRNANNGVAPVMQATTS